MNIIIKIINIIRKIFKSLGKKEKKIIHLIKYLTWLNRNDTRNLDFTEENILKDKNFFLENKLWPEKIAAFIIFSYNENRLKFIARICKNVEKININTDITIIVNAEGFEKKEIIEKTIKEHSTLTVNFFCPQNLLDPRLLTYAHFEMVKEKIKDKSYSHFLYLEDDILINEENIKYWITARESLKPFGLIPVFLRSEINNENKEKYLVDSLVKNRFFFQPKIFNKNKKFAFTNLLNFFTPTYFYDRELMLEHLSGPSSSIDYGHGTFDQKSINPNMQELGVMERASTLLAFKNVPRGFLHRNVVPVNVVDKSLREYCLIEHLSNKFTNEPGYHGNIKVKEIFY